VHEQRLAALVREIAPQMAVACASEVVPEIREYERTSTTTANVYVTPLMARYLEDLERRLAEREIPGQLYIMQSSGGIALRRSPASADPPRRVRARRRRPGRRPGRARARRGEASVVRHGRHDRQGVRHRQRRAACRARVRGGARRPLQEGLGLPIRVPVIEMIEIGAGGGSIARVDRMGLLKVGPDSAGADPGPACYNLGGRQPTVTDADLLLGYLDADSSWAGACGSIARPPPRHRGARRPALGLDVTQAAWGIHRVVNENMAAAARIHGIERGKDLRSYPLFGFGGAGPVHCWQVAHILKVPRILLPFGAGAMSAYGLLAAPLAFDFVRTGRQRLDGADWTAIMRLFTEMEAEGRALLARAGVAARDVAVARIAEMRYLGQGHEVEAAVPLGNLSAESLPMITTSFEAAYRALYHRLPQGVAIEALNWRVTVAGPDPKIALTSRAEPGRAVVAGP